LHFFKIFGVTARNFGGDGSETFKWGDSPAFRLIPTELNPMLNPMFLGCSSYRQRSNIAECLVFSKKFGFGTCHYARACYIRLTLNLVPRFRGAPKQVGRLVSSDMSAVVQQFLQAGRANSNRGWNKASDLAAIGEEGQISVHDCRSLHLF
jgi:hypothetical protein